MRPWVVMLSSSASLLLGACSTIITVADVAVSTGVAVVGTAADLTVTGVKAVAGAVSGSGEEKKKD